MKKNIIVLLSIVWTGIFAQVPPTINYQGIARNAAGSPIINTTITLQFKITTSDDPAFYQETQLAVPVNSLGLFNTKIGKVTPLPQSGWEALPAILEVLIDTNGSGFVSFGTQTLSSVPYAFYALNSGSALPPGTRNGQTMRWDSLNGTWQNSDNITNDDLRVGIGLFPNEYKSKLSVATNNPQDTSVVTALHFGAQNRTAGFRSIVAGNTTPTSTNAPLPSAIFGAQNIAYNLGSGAAIGVAGYGSSKGYGAGLAGFGSTQSALGTAVGLFASADSTSPGTKKFAAIFDKGAVVINDSLLLNPFKYPGTLGDVLTLTGFNGRATWKPAVLGPWKRILISSTFNTALTNPSDRVSIGLPLASSANEKLHLHNSTGDAYMQFTTNGSFASVGLVFGESSNISKGVLRFDNGSNSLTYQLFSKRIIFVDGNTRATLVGKIPTGALSQSPFNVYDSVNTSTTPRPILKVINTNAVINAPTALFLGHDNNIDGINLVFRKNTNTTTFSLEDNTLNTKFHTFNTAGRFSPGSDGTSGKSFIQSGNTLSDDITIGASTNGNIVNAGFTKLGNNGPPYPAIQVLEFFTTMPATASGNAQINLAPYITNASQIESVQVLVTTPNRIVPTNYTITPGYECQYEIGTSTPTIFVWATAANSISLFSQPVKVVVTIKK